MNSVPGVIQLLSKCSPLGLSGGSVAPLARSSSLIFAIVARDSMPSLAALYYCIQALLLDLGDQEPLNPLRSAVRFKPPPPRIQVKFGAYG